MARNTNSKSTRLLVGICAYNEEGSELQNTLCSLAMQEESADVEMEVLVALDGWFMASPSMKAYLNELFYVTPEDPEMCINMCDALTHSAEKIHDQNIKIKVPRVAPWDVPF